MVAPILTERTSVAAVNLDEENQQQAFSASSTTILDEDPIMNGGLAATLLLCQNKGLLEMTVQKVARVEALNKSLLCTALRTRWPLTTNTVARRSTLVSPRTSRRS